MSNLFLAFQFLYLSTQSQILHCGIGIGRCRLRSRQVVLNAGSFSDSCRRPEGDVADFRSAKNEAFRE